MDLSEVKKLTELDAASVLLLRAADYIERHGWCQGKLFQPDGRACLVGALQKVAAGDYLVDPVHNAAWKRLQDSLNGFVGVWNDEEGRTQDEAVAKLRSVALESSLA